MRNPTDLRTPGRIREAERTTELLAARDAWLREIDASEHFHRLFDLLHGVYFFAKDRQGRTMLVSRSILERYGMNEDREMLGMTDFDLNPENLAAGYVSDDAEVYRTGEPILHRLEIWTDARGIPDWYIVHKLPIRSRCGEIIGVMGILQKYSGSENMPAPFYDIAPVVDYIRAHYREPIRLEDLAEMASISVRQLERRFKSAFGVTPHDFVIKTRIVSACRVLRESRRALLEVALDHGFCDQSAFTHYFKRYVGTTPSQYRRSSPGPMV